MFSVPCGELLPNRKRQLLRLFEWIIAGLNKINRVILVFCKYGTIVILGVITVIIGAGVFWRFVLNNSLGWIEEAAKYLLVWMTFTGAPIALNAQRHVGIKVLVNALPSRFRQANYFLIYTIILILLAFLIYHGYGLTIISSVQIAASFKMNLAFVYLSIPIGSAIMFLIALEFLFRALIGLMRPAQEVHPLRDVDAEQIRRHR